MSLTRAERQGLKGPAIVGAFAGTLAALALAGLHTEYGESAEPLYPGIHNWAIEALVTWVLVTAVTIAVFGAMPVVIARMAARRQARDQSRS